MVKKRVRDVETLPDAAPPAEESGSEDDVDMINVDFEWFNMKPTVDFHGLKTLLRQLFDVDHQLFDLSALADLILSQPTIGSTVKVDGEETDPYAFITVLNMHTHRDTAIMRDLRGYLVGKCQGGPAQDGGAQDSTPPPPSVADMLNSDVAQIGLVLSERLINIPAEIAPPLYTMLQAEIQDAVDDEEPYAFTHYLILSKTYREIASKLDQEDAPRQKKTKKGDAASGEVYYFHPEDEVAQAHALGWGSFPYTKDQGDEAADSKRAFHDVGIKPQGHVILIEAARFDDAVKAIGQYLHP